ncbi:MAG: 3-deoxy-7-phosphoheptulonate synthase [Pseudonocardiales bacterium]|jgi:3-deoxy-7-phosphoheptulonate synthase|uniref:3-deoxy-7-phosphoheptulonate synthase n=1 Tax=Pseudonocardia sp. Cha107L01 TaxID=3457576 RepID=UPI0028C723FB|nr:3-deoxy-7-phosphoheptulonate synthase [Pseudonocardiales bacterium]MDT7584256.1 3-deoxy-7-phosphoheptulonate synthase [Pseudonocardiales bacterium]MDT7591327.1 3-deoxy-7-phosphoheptulonate synthase [Pseudonocardiales bacterium]MDT7609793.1 3-deoxy-7-phosphoheptulonate synthase [Pseudonocardiales bacterium]MDT7621920.1 3-deoxy-7-phosphoheptulonate synthase [Pseudonocardiales bacterium]
MTVVDEPRVAAPLDGRRTAKISPLISPALLRQEHPMSPHIGPRIERARAEITDILNGVDDRLVVVVGPCSIHDRDAALEYAALLAKDAERLAGQLRIVMRVYFEKPRTTLGWKGLINDPELDGSFAVNKGLRLARGLLLEVSELGLPVGCEFLDPIIPQFLADVVSWGAIGARTAASQVHRQLCSALSMPVGIKNSTEGDVQVAVDGVRAAAGEHVFPGINSDGLAALISTTGNPDCHVILRGGSGGPNYSAADVIAALGKLRAAGLPERLIIDASHGNSGKSHVRQGEVVSEIAARVAGGERGIMGVMLESFLVAGRQDLTLGRAEELTRGQSITDACMSWDTTSALLEELAKAVEARR